MAGGGGGARHFAAASSIVKTFAVMSDRDEVLGDATEKAKDALDSLARLSRSGSSSQGTHDRSVVPHHSRLSASTSTSFESSKEFKLAI